MMPWVNSFLGGLRTVATSAYAFVAYVCLLAGFIYWLVSQIRLNAIARLPAEQQAAVLKKEYNVFPRSGLSGEEWIRSRRQTLTFWAFVVLIVAVVLLSTISLLKGKTTTPTGTPTETTATNNTSTANTALDEHQVEAIPTRLYVGEDVSSIAFSSDGKSLFAGTYGNSIKIWAIADTSTAPGNGTSIMTEIPSVGAGIQSVTVSTDWLVAGGFDNKIRIYKVAELTESPQPSIQSEQDGKVYAVALSLDGKLLASGTTKGTVTLWNENDGVWVPHRIYAHSGPVNSVAFSPDGSLLASGSDDRTIKVWDIVHGREIKSPQRSYFARHDKLVAAVAFNQNGTELASASFDNSVRIWNLSTTREIGYPLNLPDACYTVAFSGDGQWLAAGGGDDAVWVWDTSHLARRVVGRHDKRVTSVAFGKDPAHWLASASVDRTIRFWPKPH